MTVNKTVSRMPHARPCPDAGSCGASVCQFCCAGSQDVGSEWPGQRDGGTQCHPVRHTGTGSRLGLPSPQGPWIARPRRYVYDEFGQVVAQRIYDRDMKALYQVTSYQYDADGNNLSYKVTANLTEKSELLYSNVYAQTFTGIGAQRQLTRIEVSSSNAQFKAGQTNQHYTADGRLFSVDNRGASYKRFFADDEGMVLKASTADTSGAASPQRAEERQLVVNSQVVQRWDTPLTRAGPRDDKGLPRYGQISGTSHSVDRIDLSTSVGQLNSVSVQSGDTLRSVAQRVYGDTSKWYLLAQANGMAADDQLAAGTSPQVPHQVSGTYNSADTFKPP